MTDQKSPALPTDFISRFVRYVVGFGVAVGVGMAPFLGKYKIPGFDAMLELFPRDLQATLIPLSAFLMGLVAIGVQFMAGEGLPDEELRRRFRMDFRILVAALVLLVCLYFFFVEVVKIDGEARAAFMVTPWRLPDCPCTDPDDKLCIASLSLNSNLHGVCWGGTSLKVAKATFTLTYLVLMGGFAGLVGLLVVLEAQRRAERRHSRKEKAAPGPTPPS